MVTNGNLSMRYSGTSADAKPSDGVANGSSFYEIDTGMGFWFDAEHKEWREAPRGESGGGSGESIPSARGEKF